MDDDITRRFDKPSPSDSPTSNEDDNKMKPGWYRFLGTSGNVLKEGYDNVLGPNENLPNFCSTRMSGTLLGSHPTEEEGVVEMTVCFRRPICYRQDSNCPCADTKTIYVRNCRKHFVYFLMPTKKGQRYCTNKIVMPKKDGKVFICLCIILFPFPLTGSSVSCWTFRLKFFSRYQKRFTGN